MVELYLQNNMLTDLDNFIAQPRMKELRLENNFIVSFKGFLPQPKLEQVSIKASSKLNQHEVQIWVLFSCMAMREPRVAQ
jgi:hypothetical protein